VTADLRSTRDAWHRVAEHVLAAGQHSASGTIRLRVGPGGFRTTAGVAGRQLAVEGDRLVVEDGGDRRSIRLTTLREVAAFAGVEPGLRGSYSPATDADPDAPLGVEPAAAADLAAWYALGDTALRRFAPAVEPVLWPEHFDLAVAVEAVNYGCSPGDRYVAVPYLYVGPHEPPPRDDFWNQPFGAALPGNRVRGTADAVAFFAEGRARVPR
jgi:hypothetical protein